MSDDHAVHELVTILTNAAIVADHVWPQVCTMQDAGRAVRLTANVLNALVDGHADKIGPALDELDKLLHAIPNGDTTPGAT